jgi:serine/threonine-protein kinase
MELLHGTSLRRRMADTDRPAFSDVALQVCRALEYAHSKGILHRDLKPENIYVCDDGTLKLMDFGLARQMDSTTVSQHSVVAGTVAYMAPEQLKGEKLDGRTDLYALGVLLYEYIGGQPPFSADNPGAVMLKHLTEQPASLRTRIPSLPVEIEALVMRLLAKDPNFRFASASALRAALERPTPSGNATSITMADAVARIPNLTAQIPAAHIPSVPPPPVSAIPMPAIPHPARRSTDVLNRPAAPAPRRRSAWPLIALLLLLLGGGAYGAFVFGQRLHEESEKNRLKLAATQGKANAKKGSEKAKSRKNDSSGARSASGKTVTSSRIPPGAPTRYSDETNKQPEEATETNPEQADPGAETPPEETTPPSPDKNSESNTPDTL